MFSFDFYYRQKQNLTEMRKSICSFIDTRFSTPKLVYINDEPVTIYEISKKALIFLFILYVFLLFFYSVFFNFLLQCLIAVYDYPPTIILLILSFLAFLIILWSGLLAFFLLIHADMDELGYYFVIIIALYCYGLYLKDRFWDKPVDKFVDPKTGKLLPDADEYVERIIKQYREDFPDADVDSIIDVSINRRRKVPWESDTKKFIKKVINYIKSIFGIK